MTRLDRIISYYKSTPYNKKSNNATVQECLNRLKTYNEKKSFLNIAEKPLK